MSSLRVIAQLQGFQFNRVAQRRPGPVAFDVIDAVRRYLSQLERGPDNLCLSDGAGGCKSRFLQTVIIHRRAFDDRINLVAVIKGILQTLQDGCARSVSPHDPFSTGVKRPAFPVRG
ncbi:hypothetical protein D3C73_627910 [compost metagenome]